MHCCETGAETARGQGASIADATEQRECGGPPIDHAFNILQETPNNAVHGVFLHGKAKNAVFSFCHFQSLVAIENGGTSLCRAGSSIFPKARFRCWPRFGQLAPQAGFSYASRISLAVTFGPATPQEASAATPVGKSIAEAENEMSDDNSDPKKGAGDKILAMRANWSFDGDTPDHFVSHLRRSVPLYDLGHELTCQLSDFFVHSGSTCYEIGVSTGELIRRLADHNALKPNVRWVGMDSVEAMVARAREHTAGYGNIDLLVDDATTFEFAKTDFFVSYYCVQFIPPRLRQPLFDKIYESLNWGGALVLFEKVRAPDARFQDISVALYDDFKRGQGFDDSEILAKTRSLRGVLEPYTSEANREYLTRAGFRDIVSVMKYVCFEGYLAIK